MARPALPTQRVLSQGIADGKTRNAVDQLSRRIASVEAAANASVAAVTAENAALKAQIASHAASITKLTTGLNWATQLAVAASPDTSKTTSPIGTGPGTPPPVTTSPPAGTDNGAGAAGFSSPFPSGTAPAGSPLTPQVAGQIVGGVATQFNANYFAGPAGNQAILDSWRACFNERCIFHLNQAGFQTSHYPGAGAGSIYLILINIPSQGQPNNQYAYQITNYDPTLTLTAQMLFVGTIGVGIATAPDPGIPDSTVCP